MIFGTIIKGSGYFNVDNTNILVGIEFTAWKNMRVTGFRVYSYYGTLKLRLYEDGVLVAESPSVAQPPNTYWYEYSIDYTLTAGKKYRFVLVLLSNWSRVYFVTTINTKYLRFQKSDEDSNLLGNQVYTIYSSNGGSTWTYYTDRILNFLLVLDDGSCWGNPYTNVATFNVYGTNYIGEKIVITNTSKTINTVTVFGYRYGNPPDLVVEIKDAETGQIVSSGSITASAVPTSSSIISIPVNEVTLEVGKTYYVYLKCKDNGGDSSNYYYIYFAKIDTEQVYNLGIIDTNIRYASWGGA